VKFGENMKKPKLTLVLPDAIGIEPPFILGEPGRSLWDRVQAEYAVSDAGGVEMLAQACAGADLAAQLNEEIQRDGPTVRGRNGVRTHPAVKDVIAARAFVVRTLIKLGIAYEPTKPGVGRPPGWEDE
jgi:hypothetical protein